MACPLQEFIQVGYYVNNDYQDAELREFPPEKPLLDRYASHAPPANPTVPVVRHLLPVKYLPCWLDGVADVFLHGTRALIIPLCTLVLSMPLVQGKERGGKGGKGKVSCMQANQEHPGQAASHPLSRGV